MHIHTRTDFVNVRLWLPLLLFTATLQSYGQATKETPSGYVEQIDPALSSIVNKNAKVSVIVEGCIWCEGPLWVEEQKALLFSDIQRNSIYKWTEAKGKELYLTPSGYTGIKPRGGEAGSNGLLLNNKRELVILQHGDRRIAVMDAPLASPKPVFKTIADHYQGKKFDSPNDAVFNSKGDLYFTDPPYGLENYISDTLKEAPYQGVYKVSADGKVTLLTDTLTRPNGIALLPGGRTLLVANSDSAKARWYAYDLDENGLITKGRIFYDVSDHKTDMRAPDGMKVDRQGNVFATGPGGIWIFNKEGKVLGRIRTNVITSNCAFADNDKTLFITAGTYILRVNLR